MIKVLFVCHGNICRSPMAEFMFRKYLADRGVDGFYIDSAATSSEELGNPVYPPAKRILKGLGIDCSRKLARRITLDDYDNFDYIIGMDERNVHNMLNLFGGDKDGKIRKLLDFCDGAGRDVSDPWYTGDFDGVKNDIEIGIDAFYKYLSKANG